MGTRARALRPLALATALALLLAACGPSGPAGTTAPGTEITPQKGGRIIEGSFSDIKTLQPILVSDNPSSGVTALLYDSLVYIEPKSGQIKPNLGKWTLSADGLTYSWQIRADANWSDGKPVIAADFLTGVKAIAKSKKTVRKSSYTDVAGFNDYQSGKTEEISGIKIDSADPKKFTVTFTRVFCPALVNAFGSNYILPTQVFGKYVTATSKDEIDLAPENTEPKVVNGPFTFSEWRKGDQVILKRNEAYWDGAPYVDEYVYKVVADATVLAAQLKTGELNYGPVEPKDLADIDAQPHLKSYKWQQLNYTYIGWNVKSQTAPALQDKRVRQALAYGLDMDAVVRSILLGQGTKQVAHHVPASWASPGAANLDQYAYDRNKAEDLLKQAGFAKGADGVYAKDGKPLEFSIVANSGNKTRETLLQVATEQYKAIGVKVNPKLEAFETMVDKLTTGNQEIQAWIIGWSLGAEPDPQGIWHSSQIPDPVAKRTGFNFGGFTNSEFDKAIDQGRTPSDGNCSQEARKKHYETFNKILNEEQPYNFGFSPNAIWVISDKMRGYDPGAFGHRWNIHKWWYTK